MVELPYIDDEFESVRLAVRVVEPPERYRPRAGDRTVFLAGGVRHCPDWRSEAVTQFTLSAHKYLTRGALTVFSAQPLPQGSPFCSDLVAWEHEHLHCSDVTLFWFPEGDERRPEQPIAMYELGAAAASSTRRIVVGADPGYARYHDLVAQLRCARPGLTVHTDLRSAVTRTLLEICST